eukprot:COSAG06_NODE_30852_length_531_cov_0.949074_1_plen_21_part_10
MSMYIDMSERISETCQSEKTG